MVGYDDTYLEFAENDDRLSSVGRNICEGYLEYIIPECAETKTKRNVNEYLWLAFSSLLLYFACVRKSTRVH